MAIKIGLDAGHGGDSTGTYTIDTAINGLYEKDLTLELCNLVAERLVAHGFEVFKTRTTDVNCGNVLKRAEMCVAAGCKFAVSVHFNGFGNESANGTEVFVPYAEKAAGIEAGFQEYLGKFFKLRAPFARCNSYYDRNKIFDKKLNLSTRKFEAFSNDKEYFGFIRTAWENGLSADLLEVCFLTNRKDYDTYIEHKEKIADAIARSIVEGYKVEWKPQKPKEELKKEAKKSIGNGRLNKKRVDVKF